MLNYISRRPGPGGAQRNDQNRGANGVPQMHELGAMLRKRREAMGATLAEVETATKIRQKYLAALEADEWQLLPGEVVGRGFLRNYATYLGLDANELVERRRAVADPGLATALAGTSAVSALPPPRQVDYRPKDVPLHEEEDGIEQRREVQFGPILTVAGMVLLLLLVTWTIFSFGGRMMAGVANLVEGVQGWTSTAFREPTATPTTAAQVAIATPPPTFTATSIPATPTSAVPADSAGTSSDQVLLVPTATPNQNAGEVAPPAAPGDVAVDATATPIPVVADQPTPPPTETPLPELLPPTETPTETPTEPPPAPVVVAPICPDGRSLLSAPGVNAVVTGDVAVIGSATHEAFQYYKLEFAPGADVSDGFVYFGGANTQVAGGLLGTFASGAVSNGAYTIRLVVVDQTGNFPSPCQVTIFVQN